MKSLVQRLSFAACALCGLLFSLSLGWQWYSEGKVLLDAWADDYHFFVQELPREQTAYGFLTSEKKEFVYFCEVSSSTTPLGDYTFAPGDGGRLKSKPEGRVVDTLAGREFHFHIGAHLLVCALQPGGKPVWREGSQDVEKGSR